MPRTRAGLREALLDRELMAGHLEGALSRLLPRLGARTAALYGHLGEELARLAVAGEEGAACPVRLPADLVAPPWPCDRTWSLEVQGRTVGRLLLGGQSQQTRSGEVLAVELPRLAAAVERLLIRERRRAMDQVQARARALEDRRSRSQAVVSHQLKTPLQLGQGLVSDALAHAADTGRVARRLDTLFEALKRFNRSIVALFDRHGIHLERHRRQLLPVNLLSQCEQMLKELEPALRRKRLTPSLVASPEVWGLADPLRFEIVLDNLLGNAIKAAPRDSGVQIVVRSEEGRACIRVTNPGGPIPGDRLEGLFRPLPPNPDDPTSTGLGLALTHDYLVQMGGGLDLLAHEHGEVVFEGWVRHA
ncbi:MAG: HAMP domain-containing sensor histidine kinase [bacterium]|nr:HAMP domain-containing sensor histidine kinase [bacterium]